MAPVHHKNMLSTPNLTKKPTRTLSPYEKNQLRKYDIPESTALQTETPVEYLTHHVEFCGLDFYVDESVLIPRIETEELVAMAVSTAQSIHKKVSRKISIVDVGTGSGAIAICVAHQLTKLTIPFELLATEISDNALKVAQKNKENLVSDAPVTVKKNDLLSGVTKQFDLIVSNLPYIPTQRIPFLAESVKNFEPHLALDGGKTGLSLINTLINQAEKLTYPHTKVLLEVDYTHGYADFADFRKKWDIIVTPDSMAGTHFVELSIAKTMSLNFC